MLHVHNKAIDHLLLIYSVMYSKMRIKVLDDVFIFTIQTIEQIMSYGREKKESMLCTPVMDAFANQCTRYHQ